MGNVARINDKSQQIAVSLAVPGKVGTVARAAAFKAGAEQARFGGLRIPPEGLDDQLKREWNEGYVAMRMEMGHLKSAKRTAELKAERRAAKAVSDLFGYPEDAPPENVIELHK